MRPLLFALAAGCAHAPDPGVQTTVVVEPPPPRAPPIRRVLEGCPRINPTCTYQALAVEFGRSEAVAAHCAGRLGEPGGPEVVATARVDGIARLEGPASWDILDDLQALARGTMRTCYQEGLRVEPALEGVIELEFLVEAERSCVSEIFVVSSTVADEVTLSCVVDALMGYPLPSAGSQMSARLIFERK